VEARETPIKDVVKVIMSEFHNHLKKYVSLNNFKYEIKLAPCGIIDKSVDIILSPGLIETENIL